MSKVEGWKFDSELWWWLLEPSLESCTIERKCGEGDGWQMRFHLEEQVLSGKRWQECVTGSIKPER